MNVLVCVKRVPDTGTNVEIQDDGINIKEENLSWVLNPYDEYAVEEAIRIKERFGGKVTLLTAEAEGGEEILRKGIAMGADEGIYIKDPALKGLNGSAIARILSRAIATIPFDLMLCGKQGTDENYGLVGGAIAGLLNIPMVSSIKKLCILPDKRQAEVHREVEGGIEVLKCPLPALFTAQKGLNEPRYPSLPAIMKSKRQEIRSLDLNSLDIKEEDLKSSLKRKGLSYPSSKHKGVILNGNVKESVSEIVKFFQEEIKII